MAQLVRQQRGEEEQPGRQRRAPYHHRAPVRVPYREHAAAQADHDQQEDERHAEVETDLDAEQGEQANGVALKKPAARRLRVPFCLPLHGAAPPYAVITCSLPPCRLYGRRFLQDLTLPRSPSAARPAPLYDRFVT